MVSGNLLMFKYIFFQKKLLYILGFPGDLDDKESTCNSGDKV